VTEYADKLEMLALTDPLTGIDNYRNFMQKGLKEIKRGIRLQKPLCVGILDLDHFKSINDQYGHNTGDVVLKEFSNIVMKCLRLEDEFGRIGGEEFGLLLPHTRLSDAKTVADRIRTTVEITPIVCEDKEIYISVSIGVAEANPKVMTLDHVLNAADKALYKAKQKGRNRVEINREFTTDSNVVVLGKGLGKGSADS
jgi:diguanylate cyclase (GGDEF)-like protein